MELNIKTRMTCLAQNCGSHALLVPTTIIVRYDPDDDLRYYGTAEYECVRGHKTKYPVQRAEEWLD